MSNSFLYRLSFVAGATLVIAACDSGRSLNDFSPQTLEVRCTGRGPAGCNGPRRITLLGDEEGELSSRVVLRVNGEEIPFASRGHLGAEEVQTCGLEGQPSCPFVCGILGAPECPRARPYDPPHASVDVLDGQHFVVKISDETWDVTAEWHPTAFELASPSNRAGAVGEQIVVRLLGPRVVRADPPVLHFEERTAAISWPFRKTDPGLLEATVAGETGPGRLILRTKNEFPADSRSGVQVGATMFLQDIDLGTFEVR